MSNVLSELKKRLDANYTIQQFKAFLGELSEEDLHGNHSNSQTGNFTSILNYLIEMHSEQSNLLYHCAAVLEAGVDVNKNQSLHLALRLNKAPLARLFLTGEALVCAEHELYEEDEISIEFEQVPLQAKKLDIKHDLNARDITEGKTLIARVLETKNDELLELLLSKSLDLNNQPSSYIITGFSELTLSVPNQLLPLHQAVLQDYSSATQLLINSGADISKSCLQKAYTPILLAAKTGAINSMQCLLNADSQKIIAEATTEGKSAVDLLCERLQNDENPEKAIKGLALLFFHGANAPKLPQHVELLMTHRKSLARELRQCKTSVKRSPVEFMHKIHCQTDPLHQLFFEQSALSSLIQHCLFKPSSIVRKLESLISDHDQQFSQDERYFAEFTKRYTKEIKQRTFLNPFNSYNPFSPVRWGLAEGTLQTWQQILDLMDSDSIAKSIVRELTNSQIVLSHDWQNSPENEIKPQ